MDWKQRIEVYLNTKFPVLGGKYQSGTNGGGYYVVAGLNYKTGDGEMIYPGETYTHIHTIATITMHIRGCKYLGRIDEKES